MLFCCHFLAVLELCRGPSRIASLFGSGVGAIADAAAVAANNNNNNRRHHHHSSSSPVFRYFSCVCVCVLWVCVRVVRNTQLYLMIICLLDFPLNNTRWRGSQCIYARCNRPRNMINIGHLLSLLLRMLRFYSRVSHSVTWNVNRLAHSISFAAQFSLHIDWTGGRGSLLLVLLMVMMIIIVIMLCSTSVHSFFWLMYVFFCTVLCFGDRSCYGFFSSLSLLLRCISHHYKCTQAHHMYHIHTRAACMDTLNRRGQRKSLVTLSSVATARTTLNRFIVMIITST